MAIGWLRKRQTVCATIACIRCACSGVNRNAPLAAIRMSVLRNREHMIPDRVWAFDPNKIWPISCATVAPSTSDTSDSRPAAVPLSQLSHVSHYPIRPSCPEIFLRQSDMS